MRLERGMVGRNSRREVSNVLYCVKTCSVVNADTLYIPVPVFTTSFMKSTVCLENTTAA